MKHRVDEMVPSMYSFNRYMRVYGKRDVHTYTETPHSWHNGMVGKHFWDVLDSAPDRLDRFNRGLSMFAALHPVVAIFPFESVLQAGNSSERPLMVDIGGGRGLALLEMRKGCPSLQGQLILQDRPEVLDAISPQDLPDVTKMAHDFFSEQPVKNAQMYYIRRVMHDWQDEDAARIMKAIVPAMAPDSRIIISDTTLPEPATPEAAHAIWLDIMMLTIGGKERTAGDWNKLADLSGLKLVRVWQDPAKFGPLCVVEYMLPDANSQDTTIESAKERSAMDEQKQVNEDNSTGTPKVVSTTETEGFLETEQRDEDWEERTVVGDRDQSVEPGQHA